MKGVVSGGIQCGGGGGGGGGGTRRNIPHVSEVQGNMFPCHSVCSEYVPSYIGVTMVIYVRCNLSG